MAVTSPLWFGIVVGVYALFGLDRRLPIESQSGGYLFAAALIAALALWIGGCSLLSRLTAGLWFLRRGGLRRSELPGLLKSQYPERWCEPVGGDPRAVR